MWLGSQRGCEALLVLRDIMRGEGLDKSIAHLRLTAAEAILNRGVGKAAQQIAVDLNLDKKLTELTDAELLELSERYKALNKPVQVIEHDPDEANSS